MKRREETLPAGTCPDLPAGLSVDLTGSGRVHFHLSTDANGLLHINGNVSIAGAAVDSDAAASRSPRTPAEVPTSRSRGGPSKSARSSRHRSSSRPLV